MSYCNGSCQAGDWTRDSCVSWIGRQILYLWCHLCVNIFVFLWLTSLFMSGSRFITSQDPIWLLFITIFHCVYGREVNLHFMSLSQDLGRTRLHFGELCCCSLDKRKWNTEYCILALRGVLTNMTHSISIHFFFFWPTQVTWSRPALCRQGKCQKEKTWKNCWTAPIVDLTLEALFTHELLRWLTSSSLSSTRDFPVPAHFLCLPPVISLWSL